MGRVAVLLAVGAVLIVLTPSVPFHAQYRANDAAEFFQAFAAAPPGLSLRSFSSLSSSSKHPPWC
jgi:hypothetical protein